MIPVREEDETWELRRSYSNFRTRLKLKRPVIVLFITFDNDGRVQQRSPPTATAAIMHTAGVCRSSLRIPL